MQQETVTLRESLHVYLQWDKHLSLKSDVLLLSKLGQLRILKLLYASWITHSESKYPSQEFSSPYQMDYITSLLLDF